MSRAPGRQARASRREAMNVELSGRLRRLMLFRVVMVTTLLSIATYVEAVSETLRAVNPLYFVIVATYGLTVAHALALRFAASPAMPAYAQIGGDLLTITALVYVTGGVRPGFQLLYPLAVLSATMLVSRRGALAVAGLATLLYGGLLLAVRGNFLAPRGLEDVLSLPPRALVYAAFVLGVACATVALLGTYLAESLKSAGRQLRAAAVEVADLRELNQVIVNSIQSGLMTTDADGRVLYALKNRWRDGTSHVAFEPVDFVARLAALVPPPRCNLVRYHGILAPAARFRVQVVPEGPAPTSPDACHVGCLARESTARAHRPEAKRAPTERTPPRPRSYSWPELMKRVFVVDVLECASCGGRLRILAAIHSRDAIRAILECLGLPSRAPPIAPAAPDPEREGINAGIDFDPDYE